MNRNESHDDALLETLVSKLLDGSFTSGERAQLAALLSDSEIARREYLDMIAVHTALREEFGAQFVEAIQEPVTPRISVQRRVAASVARYSRYPLSVSPSVAALVLILAVTILAFMSAPGFRQTADQDGKGAPQRRRIVAELTGLREAVWAKGQTATHRGALLRSGYPMELREGFAQVTFRRGATITVEGPATWVLHSDGSMKLDAGQLVAQVPEKAVGFTVDTPTATITDLGTEFGVVVRELGTTDTFVYKGRVSLASNADDSSWQRILTAGQGVRVADDGQIAELVNRPSLVRKIESGGPSGQRQKLASYEYTGKNGDPRKAKLPDDRYSDINRTKLVDGAVGSSGFKDGRWVGWFDSNSTPDGDGGEPYPAIVFDTGKLVSLQSLHIAYLVEHDWGIHAPDRIVVSVSNDGESFDQIHEYRDSRNDWPYTGKKGSDHGISRIARINLAGAEARYVRLEFYNGKQWTFLSEVFFMTPTTDDNPQP